MFDFVHLDWRSFKYDPPTDGPGDYLCLVYLHDVDPAGKAELQILHLEPLGGLPNYEGEWDIQDSEERSYPKDTVIAWADTSKFTFTCDWKKNEKCNKSFCSARRDDGPCSETTELEYAEGLEEFL